MDGGNLGLQLVGEETVMVSSHLPVAGGEVVKHDNCPRGCVFHMKDPPRIEYPQCVTDTIYDSALYEKMMLGELHPPVVHGNDDLEQSLTIDWLGQTARITSNFDYPRTLTHMLLVFMMMGSVGASNSTMCYESPEAAVIIATGQAIQMVMDSLTNMLYYLGILYIIRIFVNKILTEYDFFKILGMNHIGNFFNNFLSPIVNNIVNWFTVNFTQFSAWSITEYQDLKRKWLALQFISAAAYLVPSIFSMLGGILKYCFKSKETTLFQQGARQDANKAGMFMVGLLSLCMIVLAPVIGAKKIVQYISPVLDILRQVPYASWIVDWLIKWSKGEVDFDDLPQDTKAWGTKMEEQDAADLYDDLKETRKEMKREATKPDDYYDEDKPSKSENLNTKKPSSIRRTSDQEKEILECIKPDLEEIEERRQREADKKACRFKIIPTDKSRSKFAILHGFNFRSQSIVPKEDLHLAFPPIYELAGSEGLIEMDGMYFTYDELFVDEVEVDSEDCDDEMMMHQQGLKDQYVWVKAIHGMLFYNRFMKHANKVPLSEDAPTNTENIEKCKKKANEDLAEKARETGNRQEDIETHDEEKVKADDEFYDSMPTWDGVYDWCAEKATQTAKFMYDNRHKIAAGLGAAVAIGTAIYLKQENPSEEEAGPQGKGKTKRGRGTRRTVRTKKTFQPSGGAEKELYEEIGDDYDYQQDEYDPVEEYADSYYDQFEQDDDDGYSTYARGDDYEHRPKKRERTFATAPRQAVSERSSQAKRRLRERRELQAYRQEAKKAPVLPTLRDDSDIKRKIYNSKRKVYRAKTKDIEEFVTLAKKKMEGELTKMRKQSWNPSVKSAGVFKIYDGKNRYRCTGTLVGQRMYVVNHVMDESLTEVYIARNHVHNIELDPKTYQVMNDEIGSFFTSGVPSVFKASNLKIMDDAAIVSILGYGEGANSSPDIITGFASPKGWCNAATRCGDCSAPALDIDGNIVGFWTHGNGKTFGRFEPITEEFIELAKIQYASHSGLDFRSRPLSL